MRSWVSKGWLVTATQQKCLLLRFWEWLAKECEFEAPSCGAIEQLLQADVEDASSKTRHWELVNIPVPKRSNNDRRIVWLASAWAGCKGEHY